MKQAFDQFCLHHQRAILLLALASILTSTWYIFYGIVGGKGKKLLSSLLIIITTITVYGAWYAHQEYHQLPSYLLWVGIPYLILVTTGTLRIKRNISNAVIRPLLTAAYFVSAFWFGFCILSWLTPVFALVHY